MVTIVLKEHKAFIKKQDDNGEFIYEETDTLKPFLQSSVFVEDNFFFRDLWKLIVADKEFYELVFKQSLGSYKLDKFIEESNVVSDKDSDIHTISIERVVEVYTYADEPEANIWLHTNSRGDDPVMTYALDFSSISFCMGLKLELKRSTTFSRYEKSTVSHTPIGNVDFSVYDVLQAILYEITFYGEPAERDKAKSEVFSGPQEFKG